jgi:hypothetical protein
VSNRGLSTSQLVMSGRTKTGVSADAQGFEASANVIPNPVWNWFVRNDWVEFREEYENYKLRGGRLPLKALVHSQVVSMMSDSLPKVQWDAEEKTIIDAVAGYFAPKTLSEALRLIRDVRMEGMGERPLQELIKNFRRACTLSETLLRNMSEEVLAKWFVQTLCPDELRLMVEVRCPRNLHDAYTFSVDALYEWERERAPRLQWVESGRREGSGDHHRSAPKVDDVADVVARTDVVTVDGRQFRKPESRGLYRSFESDKCFGCGHTGHHRRECPYKGQQGFFQYGERHAPLRIDSGDKASASTSSWPPHPQHRFDEASTREQSSLHYLDEKSLSVDDSGSSEQLDEKGKTDVPPKVTDDKLKLVDCVLENGNEKVAVKALADTGSLMNVLHPAVADELKVKVEKSEHEVEVRLPNGAVISSSGKASVVLSYSAGLQHEVKLPVVFEVMRLDKEVILGLNTLEEAGFVQFNNFVKPLVVDKEDVKEDTEGEFRCGVMVRRNSPLYDKGFEDKRLGDKRFEEEREVL